MELCSVDGLSGYQKGSAALDMGTAERWLDHVSETCATLVRGSGTAEVPRLRAPLLRSERLAALGGSPHLKPDGTRDF